MGFSPLSPSVFTDRSGGTERRRVDNGVPVEQVDVLSAFGGELAQERVEGAAGSPV